MALSWEVGWTANASGQPERWVPAKVPGNVQADWAAAEGWGPWSAGENSRDYRWMEDVTWVYKASLPKIGGPATLVFEGIDYSGSIIVWYGSEHSTRNFEGANTPISIEILPGATSVEVRIDPAPSLPIDGTDRKLITATTKPGMFYGWDFAPRLVPCGIWQPVTLHTLPVLPSANVRQEWLGEQVRCFLEFDGPVNEPFTWDLLDPQGQSVGRAECDGIGEASILIDNPTRWWPNGHGEPALYTSRVTAACGAVEERRVGLRTIRLVMDPEGWDRPESRGSRNHPPITLEINGQPIFAKGANWVPPDMLPGTDDEGRYRALLTLADEANVNLLRLSHWAFTGLQRRLVPSLGQRPESPP